MRVVNVKELKARLSSYLREVDRGAAFLVTQRDRVVARLGPPQEELGAAPSPAATSIASRLLAAGVRPPLRERRSTDYRRVGEPVGLSTSQIDALVDWVREEPR